MLFRKHYLDIVTPDDRVWIIYVVELRAIGLAVRAAGVFRSAAAGQDSRSTLLDVSDPTRAGGATCWSSRSLGVSYRIERTITGPAVELLPSGGLRWDCHTLRGDVTLTDRGERVEGTGYAETIDASVPPWEYPWDTLAWGRVHEGDGAFVWTVLDGGGSPKQVFADGARAHTVGEVLAMETIRELRRGRIGETVLSALPFAEKLPGRILGLSETKIFGRSASGGRAIFERVCFPPREPR